MKNASPKTLSTFFCYHKVCRYKCCHPELDLGSLKNKTHRRGTL